MQGTNTAIPKYMDKAGSGNSSHPADTLSKRVAPFKKLFEVQNHVAKWVLRERHKSAEKIADEMGELFRPRNNTGGALVSALSAHSLGYIIRMGETELEEFWEKTEISTKKLFEEDEEVRQALVISKLRGSNPSVLQINRKIGRILGYRKDAEDHRAGCHLISDIAKLHVGDKNYKELFMEHIGKKGVFSVPALVVNILGVARSSIPKNIQGKNALEIAKTAYVVFYPVAETLALAADIIEAVRREAIEKILDLEGNMGKFGTLELYDNCAEYSDMIGPFAQWALEDLRGGLEGTDKTDGIIAKISRTKKLGVEMISPTVDPNGQYRIKGLSGIFNKIWGKREKGEAGRDGGEYGFDDLTDVVACTCMVSGELEDAEQVAQGIMSKLIAKYRGKSKDYEIDNKERPTGYNSPHITFKLKVKLGKEEVWVPIDIQVRTEKAQKKCLKTWSRGYKVSPDITEELVEQLQNDIANISASLRRRDSEIPNSKELLQLKVNVVDESGGNEKYEKEQTIEVHPDWKVASAIARIAYTGGRGRGSNKILGFAKSVSVEGISNGGNLSLFDEIPEGGISVRISKDELPRSICMELAKRDLSDLAAKEMLQRRLKAIKNEIRKK